MMYVHRVRDAAADQAVPVRGARPRPHRHPTEPYLHGRDASIIPVYEWRGPRASVDGRRGGDGRRLTHHYLLRHDVQDLPRHVDHLLDVLALREFLHALLGEGQLLRGVLGRVRS